MKNQIVFASQNETDVLGLKVARCNEEEFDAEQLKAEIMAGGYDLCRLKIPAEDEMASYKLHRTGIPFFFSGSIRRYKTPVKEKPGGSFLHPEMTYEQYDGTQDELLMQMLKGTWGDYPLGYYRTPFLCDLIDKEMEIESVFRFYRRNNLNSLNPDNSIMFMNHNGNYVGFFALNKIGGGLESHIGGILEPYRKGGYFLDMLRYIKNFCVDNHLEHFAFGARNENAYVQKIFQDVGFMPTGSENVFHLTPMLSLTQVSEKVAEIQDGDLPEIISCATDFVSAQYGAFQFSGIQRVQVSDEPACNGSRLLISMPVKTIRDFLIVIQEITVSGNKAACYYVSGMADCNVAGKG